MKIKNLLIAILIGISFHLNGQIIHVPTDQPTIQDGIDAATNGDTVLVEDGIYYENIRFLGKAITVASHFLTNGDEDHIDNTIIDGSQATDTDSASTVMFIHAEDTSSIICGFTIQGGGGTINSQWGYRTGGGILCWAAGAKILNNKITNNIIADDNYNVGGAGIGTGVTNQVHWVIVRNNEVTYNESYASSYSAFGGGIYMGLNALIENNIVENNYCFNEGEQADGGGIELEQIPGTIMEVTVKNNIIRYNHIECDKSLGAGMVIHNVNEAYILDNVITHNICEADSIAKGGGIYANTNSKIAIINNDISYNQAIGYRSYSAGVLVRKSYAYTIISDNLFAHNQCSAYYGSAGSALRVISPSSITTVSNNNFSYNESVGSSFSWGAVFLWDALNNEVIVDRNVFYKNKAMNSGGFYSRNSDKLRMTNNLFLDNTATSHGGAIFLYEYYGKDAGPDLPQGPEIAVMSENPGSKKQESHACFANNSFFFNHAQMGGAIANQVSDTYPIFFNSIFHGNSGTLGQDIYAYNAASFELSYCDFDPSHIFGGYNPTGNINCNPVLQNDSLHLEESSQCINKGTDSLLVDGLWYHSPAWDIDGDIRPYENTLPDMGADETPFTAVGLPEASEPASFTLEVFPNPVYANATIEFFLMESAIANIKVLSIEGKEIQTLLYDLLPSGLHSLQWNTANLASGEYIIMVTSGDQAAVHKVLITD